MPFRLLIVGGVAGGASAAARARRLSESAEIVMFERGPHVSFANCGLPYYLSREIADKKKLLVQSPERLKAVFNIDVRTHCEVLRIDRELREIEVKDLRTGASTRERYDALLLSTGAAPLVLPIPGIQGEGIFTLRSITDMERIDDFISNHQSQRAVVVGGGFIGLEVAEQLHRRGLQVSVVEALPQVLLPLDPEMAELVHLELRKHGVGLYLNDPVVGFAPPTQGEADATARQVVQLRSGARLPADVVILGLGVRPETKLAKEAGLTLGERGGIRVDEHLQTSDPHIWAVGDAVEVPHGVTGQSSLIALAGPANRQGRIAADNIFGRPTKYRNTIGTAILRIFDLTAAVTGANEATLKRANLPYRMVHLHPNSHAGYFPGAKPIALKILFSPGDGKLLGGQAVGSDGVDKRIDVLATALKAGMTVDDLADLELAYAPPYGSAKDPINLAGMAAQNLLVGDVEGIYWHQLADEMAQTPTPILLDVREQRERDEGFIPQSIHIPLGELRQRLHELPQDRPVIAYCQSGQRSYVACRMLKQHGFRCKNLSGAYKTWNIAHRIS